MPNSASLGLLCLLLGVAGVARADDQSVTHSLRILALGNAPPFRQEIRDGHRQEIAPPPGSLPPRLLSLSGSEKKDISTIRARLKSPSEIIQLPLPKDRTFTLIRRDIGKPWGNFETSDGSSSLILIWRDKGRGWDEPRFLALDDSPSAIPPGNIRIANISPVELLVRLGGKTGRLGSGKQTTLAIPTDEAQLVIACNGMNGKSEVIHHVTCSREENVRRQFIVYGADRDDSRQALTVFPLIDPR